MSDTAVRYRPLIARPAMPAQVPSHLTPARPAPAPADPIVVYRRRDGDGALSSAGKALTMLLCALMVMVCAVIASAMMMRGDVPWQGAALVAATFVVVSLAFVITMQQTVKP